MKYEILFYEYCGRTTRGKNMTYALFCEKCKLGSFFDERIDSFICDDCIQPERSKREDINSSKNIRNNPFLNEIPECFIREDDAVL